MLPSSWSNKEREVAENYRDTLTSLQFNSKPIINALTELAFEYRREFAHVIVHMVEERIKEVRPDWKLPVLYLVDSIVKNHREPYKDLFAFNLVSTFANVFQYANEKTRSALFKLRNTWVDIFSPSKLYDLDKKVKSIDPAWPIAKPAQTIHINPAVFANSVTQSEKDRFLEDIRRKERELMEWKKKKLDLELLVAKKEVAEKQANLMKSVNSDSSSQVCSAHPLVQDQLPPCPVPPHHHHQITDDSPPRFHLAHVLCSMMTPIAIY